MDPYATHLQALAYAVTIAPGAVLELGGGFYSSPMLAGISAADGRRVLTVEPDPSFWLVPSGPHHRVVEPGADGIHPRVEDERWLVAMGDPLVVFVDHGYAERRAESVERYLSRATLVVVHDTEPAVAGDYPGLHLAIGSRTRRDFRDLEPHTSIVAGDLWGGPL